MNTTVGEVMTCQVIAAREEADFKEIVAVMRHGHVSARPVLDSVKRLVVTDETGHLLGIVSRIDVLSVCDREDDDIRDEIVNDIIIGDCALNPDAFEVLVRCGIVTVTGQAESKAVAVQFLEAIRHVEAVVDVRDRLSYPPDDPARKAKIVAFNLFTPKR